jgi:hypothetical protein
VAVGERKRQHFGLRALADEDGTVLVEFRHARASLPITYNYCRRVCVVNRPGHDRSERPARQL